MRESSDVSCEWSDSDFIQWIVYDLDVPARSEPKPPQEHDSCDAAPGWLPRAVQCGVVHHTSQSLTVLNAHLCPSVDAPFLLVSLDANKAEEAALPKDKNRDAPKPVLKLCVGCLSIQRDLLAENCHCRA